MTAKNENWVLIFGFISTIGAYAFVEKSSSLKDMLDWFSCTYLVAALYSTTDTLSCCIHITFLQTKPNQTDLN